MACPELQRLSGRSPAQASSKLILRCLQIVEDGGELLCEVKDAQAVWHLLQALKAMDESPERWPCFCSTLHLLTVLVLEHHSLAHDFVKHEGGAGWAVRAMFEPFLGESR